ncbi:rbcG [Symbiodinium sp. CCMP2456]|nr:rbcG [Symbiodinium sp. CCMP2456]
MSDEEEEGSSEYSYEYSSEGSAEGHVDAPSTWRNNGFLNEEQEMDDSGSEDLEGEETEEDDSSDEYSEEYSEGSADEASCIKQRADAKEPQEGVDFISPDTGSAKRGERPLQGAGCAERIDGLSIGAGKGVLNEQDEYSDGSGSKGLEGEKTEEDEYRDQDKHSAQHSVAGYADVVLSWAEADEASGANQETRHWTLVRWLPKHRNVCGSLRNEYQLLHEGDAFIGCRGTHAFRTFRACQQQLAETWLGRVSEAAAVRFPKRYEKTRPFS